MSQSSGEMTRASIIESASRLFEEVGIRRATLDDIALKSGVTKRAIYYHFQSKHELISSALEFSSRRFINSLEALVLGSASIEESFTLLFTRLGQGDRKAALNGSALLHAALELAGMPGHPARAVIRHHRNVLKRIIEQALSSAGFARVDELSNMLVVLMEGAISHSCLDPGAALICEYGKIAVLLLQSHERTRLLRSQSAA